MDVKRPVAVGLAVVVRKVGAIPRFTERGTYRNNDVDVELRVQMCPAIK